MKLTLDIIRSIINEEVSGLVLESTTQELEDSAVDTISGILIRLDAEGIGIEEVINKAKQEFERNKSATTTENMREKLDKDATAGEYVEDFRDSDAPQFKGKSKKKKQQMAVAAYLDAKDNK